MILLKAADCPAKKIEQFPLQGQALPVKEVWIQWLSQAGPADSPGIRTSLIHGRPGRGDSDS